MKILALYLKFFFSISEKRDCRGRVEGGDRDEGGGARRTDSQFQRKGQAGLLERPLQ